MKQILYKLFEHQYLGREEARIILQHSTGKIQRCTGSFADHRFPNA